MGEMMVNGYCRRCSYPLDQLEHNQCPECGQKFNPAESNTYDATPKARIHRNRERIEACFRWSLIAFFVQAFFMWSLFLFWNRYQDVSAGINLNHPENTKVIDFDPVGQTVHFCVLGVIMVESIFFGWYMSGQEMD